MRVVATRRGVSWVWQPLAVPVLLFLLLYFLGPAWAQGGVASAAAARKFRVGAIVPLSGPLACYGDAISKGFELARRTFPEKFAPIEFVFQDSAYDQRTALGALQALSTIGGGVDLFYTWGVSPNDALLPVLHSKKLPVIAETSSKAAAVGKPLTVRAAPTGAMTARVLSSEIVRRSYRSVGIFLTEVPYYADILKELETTLREHGVKVDVIASFTSSEHDFRTFVAKARQRSYDAVGVFLLNDQVMEFYRQAYSLRYKTQTFGAAIHDNQKLVRDAGPGIEGAFFVGYDVQPEFHLRWLEEYKDDSMIGAIANAYDTAVLIADLFSEPGSVTLSPEEKIRRFGGVKNRRGVSGEFSFEYSDDAGNHIDFPLSLRVVRAGAVARVGVH